MVRVIAETRAGQGNASDIILVRIFIRKPTIEPLPPKDGPPASMNGTIPENTQHLGIAFVLYTGLLIKVDNINASIHFLIIRDHHWNFLIGVIHTCLYGYHFGSSSIVSHAVPSSTRWK